MIKTEQLHPKPFLPAHWKNEFLPSFLPSLGDFFFLFFFFPLVQGIQAL
jgi:hypothetical protein